MSIRRYVGVRLPWKTFVLGPVIVLAFLATQALSADSPIIRVEEDWELVVATPDANNDGPQLSTAMAPLSNLNSYYVTFELNHQSSPDFSRGGLHLQVWNDDRLVTVRTFPNLNVLSTAGETVQWTQRIDVQDGQLTFEIVNGHSHTWGDFGGQGNLKATVSSGVSSLDDYTPNISTANSGITFAANRVGSLVLKTVRAYRQDGTIVTVVLNHAVHGTTATP